MLIYLLIIRTMSKRWQKFVSNEGIYILINPIYQLEPVSWITYKSNQKKIQETLSVNTKTTLTRYAISQSIDTRYRTNFTELFIIHHNS